MEKERKKVLILAYFYPPCNMPGANRPYGWAKFLSENGYYPIVVTRSWEHEVRNPQDILKASGKELKHEVYDDHEVYYIPYKQTVRDRLFTDKNDKYVLFRKFLTLAEVVLGNFFIAASSFKSLYYFSRNLIKKDSQIRLMIATGAPYLLFKFAYKLHRKYGINWVADYRDDWNTSDIRAKSIHTNWLIRMIEMRMEKKWVGSAACHTAVSPYSVEKNTVFLNKKGYTIHNGYMPEDIETEEPLSLYDKFTVTFIGTLYPTQEIELFLEAFKRFINENQGIKDIHLLFPGLAFDTVQKHRVEQCMQGYEEYITITERVSKNEIIRIEQQTHAFLYTAHRMRGIIGSKIYEYVGLKKPVIFCPSDKETIEQIFKETGIGYGCNTTEEAFGVIKQLYNDYKSKVHLNFSNEQLERINYYSRKNQAKVLAAIFDKISKKMLSENEKPIWKRADYQQCNRCVMDTSDPEITFDDRGYCNHCVGYEQNISKLIYQGEETDKKLAQLVEEIKKSGKGKPYDCLVGVSGGVDSIYVAYLAKKMGLRPLAVHMDNGWNSELAVSNIEKILKKLDIDLYTYVLQWDEFKDLQLSFLKASVVEAETPTDIAIPAVKHIIADKYNIKYILSGGNFATEGILPKYWHYNAKDIKYLRAIHQQYGTVRLKHFPTFGFQKEMYYKLVRGIKMIYLLNYVPYDKKEIVKFLEKELDWRNYGGKHHESLYTKFVQSYYLPEKFGIDYRRATLSNQICSGAITREEAIEDLKLPMFDPVKVEEDKFYISKKLGITLDELNEILQAPPKSYKDYPNNQWLLEFIYDGYRKMKGIK